MFVFSGSNQGFCIIGFFISFAALLAPYIVANEPSTMIDINPILKEHGRQSNSTSRFSIHVIFDKRKRIERIKEVVEQIFSSSLPIDKKIEAGVQQLGEQDFLVVEVVGHKQKFMQWIRDQQSINLDIPIKAKEKQQIQEVKSILKKHNILPGFILCGNQLNPNVFYEKKSWKNEKGETLIIFSVHCRRRYNKAAIISLDMLKALHGWNDTWKFKATLDTYNHGWWHNL